MLLTENKFCDCILGSKRYFLAILTCIGLVMTLGMRCEIGLAIIEMTKLRNVVSPQVTVNTTAKIIQTREVSWSNTKVGLIEASFFIGYTVFSLPGGFISTILSPNIVFGVAVLITASLNLIVPVLVQYHRGFASVFVVRIIQGMAEGCLYPSIHAFWRYWAPKPERSKLITISFFGLALGPIIGYPVSGFITKYYGWQVNFYSWGGLCIGWSLLWLLVSRKRPSMDRWMRSAERLYIEKNTTQVIVQPSEVPWKAIVTSLPVWAIIVANVGRNWTYQFSFSGLPTFFRDKFSESSIDLGLSMSAPYVVMAILTPISGIIADCAIKRGMTTTNVRRMFNTIGFGLAAISFIVLGFIPYLWLTIGVLCIGLGSFGIGMTGFGVNHLDIADIYAGVLMGLSNGLGTVAGIVAPIIAKEITRASTGWPIFFVVSGLIHTVTTIFYFFFASGDKQPWAERLKSVEPNNNRNVDDDDIAGIVDNEERTILTKG